MSPDFKPSGVSFLEMPDRHQCTCFQPQGGRLEDRKQTRCWESVARNQNQASGRGGNIPEWKGERGPREEGLVAMYRSFPCQGHRAKVALSVGRTPPDTAILGRGAFGVRRSCPTICTSGHKPWAATTCPNRPGDREARWGPSEVWGVPPLCSDPCWVSRGRVPSPLLLCKAYQVSRPCHAQPALGAWDF